MALSAEDLAQIQSLLQGIVAQAAPQEASKGTVDPANDVAAAPWYYVHLSDGSTIQSQDSGSTHMQSPVDPDETLAVIGRYLIVKGD